MRSSIRILAFSAALLAPAALTPRADAQIRIQFQWGGRDRPLRGQRYESMRELAHDLDGRAAEAVREAAINASRGGRAERKLFSSMQDFARRAASFHERMDNYLDSPWDLRGEVSDLANRVNRVNGSLRSARIFEHAFNDWQAAVDVVQRMELVLQGQDVPVAQPRPYDRDRDSDQYQQGQERYRRDENGGYGNPGYDNGAGYQSGRSLAEVQNLARRLMDEASRADNAAGNFESDDPNVGAAAGAIHHFAQEARELVEQTSTNQVDQGQVRAKVQELQQDARTANDRMRSSGLAQSVPDWNDVLSILQQLDQRTR